MESAIHISHNFKRHKSKTELKHPANLANSDQAGIFFCFKLLGWIINST